VFITFNADTKLNLDSIFIPNFRFAHKVLRNGNTRNYGNIKITVFLKSVFLVHLVFCLFFASAIFLYNLCEELNYLEPTYHE